MATIMLVEDEEDLRFLVAHNLTKAGHEVLQAEDGIQALELLQSHLPDMIIADVSMPRMDGFELLKKVQDSGRFRDVPFLFLTARTDPTSLYKGLRLGPSDYLKKPIELSELLARVEGRLDSAPPDDSITETLVSPKPGLTPSPSTLDPGFVVNERFRIEGHLGSGAIGRVYRATQLSIGRSVALKWMFASPEHYGEKGRERFKREAALASRVVHPNVVPIHDFGIESSTQTPFVVMGLAEGRTLRSYLVKGPMRLDRALTTAIQIAGALDAAHRASVVHRDLKAENVMLVERNGEPHVTVLDFGVARSMGEADGSRLTRTGDLVGTPVAMSPEQVRGEEVGPPSDLYALGCLLHELLTGKRAFLGSSVFETLCLHIQGPRPKLDPSAGFPAELIHLHGALLAMDPEERPASAAEVEAQLRAIRDAARRPTPR